MALVRDETKPKPLEIQKLMAEYQKEFSAQERQA